MSPAVLLASTLNTTPAPSAATPMAAVTIPATRKPDPVVGRACWGSDCVTEDAERGAADVCSGGVGGDVNGTGAVAACASMA